MDIRWMLVICAGGGALLGAAIGDLLGQLLGSPHAFGMLMAAAGGAIGAGTALSLASREADFGTTQ